ncbi:MAG: VCBS repeat-containing protein [Alphaproteobacteria bacterium]|nr:VCBS repeat-containing protein [Alphaproteobacteria bacterium]
MRLAPLLLLAACSDYGLFGAKDDPNPEAPAADSGGSAPDSEPPPADSEPPEDTTPPEDTAPEARCEDESWPEEPLQASEGCEEVLPLGGFNPTLKWHATSFTNNPNSTDVIMTPAVGQLTDDNGDGVIDDRDTPDILVSMSAAGPAVLRALDGATGAEHWSTISAGLQSGGHLALGDIDGDGLLEIIGVGRDGTLRALENDGSLKWATATLADLVGSNGDAPSVADMDGDGVAELTVGDNIIRADGSVRGVGGVGEGRGVFGGSKSMPVDLDRDGQLELVAGRALYDVNANVLWDSGLEDGAVAVADLDLDGQGEIVVVSGSEVRLHEADGSLTWAVSHDPDSAESVTGASPTIADLDGDGVPEILVTTRSTLIAYDASGQRLWDSAIVDLSSASVGCVVFDFEGDGRVEVVIADELALRVLDGPTGASLWTDSRHTSGTMSEHALVADVDGDGHAEIVVGNNGGTTGLMVFEDLNDSWMPAPTLWASHLEAFTNHFADGSLIPAPSPSWPRRNTLRAPPLSVAGVDTRDLPDGKVQLDSLCELECGDDSLVLYARAGNSGEVYLEGNLTLALLGRTEAGELRLAEQPLGASIDPLTLEEGLRFELEGLQALGLTDLGLRLEGATEECDPSDDEVWLGRAPCAE